jgi:hypothetical protein
MDTLSLVLSYDNVSNSCARHQVENSISIRTLCLLIAASLWTLIALHLSVKHLTGHDVFGILEDYCLFGNGKLGDGEWEPWWWSLAEIALGSVCVTLLAITGFGLTNVNDSALGDGQEGY